MTERLIVRADGGREYGSGHIVRCLALAHMLEESFDFDFYSAFISRELGDEIEENGWRLFNVSDDEFFKAVEKDCLVILDGYHFDTNYQKRIKAANARLACIDDLHDKEFYADLIINHAPGIKEAQYQAQPYTKFALGPDYTLLRPTFIQLASTPRRIQQISSVLICFGGSDVNDFTIQTLSNVLQFREFRRIVVVTGPSYQNLSGLQAVCRDPRVTHFHNVGEREMAMVMTQVELAIVPASGVLLEAISVGNIPLICYYVENQRHLHDHLVNNYNVPSFDVIGGLSDQVKVLLQNGALPFLSPLRQRISSAPRNIRRVITDLLT